MASFIVAVVNLVGIAVIIFVMLLMCVIAALVFIASEFVYSIFCKNKEKIKKYHKRWIDIVFMEMVYYIIVAVNKYIRFINNDMTYSIFCYELMRHCESWFEEDPDEYGKWFYSAVYHVLSEGSKDE